MNFGLLSSSLNFEFDRLDQKKRFIQKLIRKDIELLRAQEIFLKVFGGGINFTDPRSEFSSLEVLIYLAFEKFESELDEDFYDFFFETSFDLVMDYPNDELHVPRWSSSLSENLVRLIFDCVNLENVNESIQIIYSNYLELTNGQADKYISQRYESLSKERGFENEFSNTGA